MSLPLLQTKLFIPPLREDMISRPHLIRRLAAGLSRKLTLVSAPAGFGKTTLLSAWIRQSQVPFCWLSLESSDNDGVTFLSYLIAALRQIDHDIDPHLLDVRQMPQPEPVQAVLIPLINQISRNEKRCGLVLDDYHLIENQEVHQVMEYLLEHQPPALHLVIASRSDPPLPLARMRARGAMNEIRAADLRFNSDEGRQLLNQFPGFHLSPETVQALIGRTEGWIAGLQMAAISLKSQADAEAYARRFSGSQEFIADYLSDEVLNGQSPAIQEFLLKTSILERLCGPLCETLTGQANSHQVLRQLKTANLFLTSLDDEGRWYRYHRLFADLLFRRLWEKEPESLPGLYRRSSDWFAAQGYLPEAVDYALRGRLYEEAALLVEQVAEEMLKRGEIATFQRWIDQLPTSLLSRHPLLSLFSAWALLLNPGDPQAAAARFENIAERVSLGGRRDTIGSMLAMYQRDSSRAEMLARQALQQLPPDDLFFRNLAGWNLSAILFLTGRPESGEAALQQVAQDSQASGNVLAAVITWCRLALAAVQRGRLHRARQLFQRAYDLALDESGRPRPVASEALIGLGLVHWEWAELEDAADYLEAGLELNRRWREQPAVEGYIALAHLHQSRGETELANQSIAQAQRIAAGTVATQADDHHVAAQQALLWLRQGNQAAAAEWAQRRQMMDYANMKAFQVSESLGASLVLRFELLVYARLLITMGAPDQAQELLAQIQPLIEKHGGVSKLIELHLLRAMAGQAQGAPETAVAALATALDLARPGDQRRLFLDEGAWLAGLLGQVKTPEAAAGFAQAIMQQRSSVAVGSRPAQAGLVEPLTNRELEVLQMLAGKQSVPQMADQLFLAPSTLRSHIKNIYAKLDVHSRFEAVEKARRAGLI